IMEAVEANAVVPVGYRVATGTFWVCRQRVAPPVVSRCQGLWQPHQEVSAGSPDCW
ncbi:hypothetical protein SK128_022084, partial [Halocaridina rubra]